jgi:hypothetical protein
MVTAFNKLKFAWVEAEDPTPSTSTLSFNRISVNEMLSDPVLSSAPANIVGPHDIDINLNGTGVSTYTISPTGTETVAELVLLLVAAIPGVTVTSENNKIVFTSLLLGQDSSVIISRPTVGANNDLLDKFDMQHQCTTTINFVPGLELILDEPTNWIINPIFDDPAQAFVVGAYNWTWDNEPNIHVMTDEEIATEPVRLEQRRLTMWQKIKDERDRRQASGVKVGENWFHSDNSSRIQQIALVIFGANLPENIMWKTLNGAFVEMTPTLAVQLFQSSAASDMAIFAVAEYHKAAMILAPNPDTYNYLTGWPPTYEGSHLL